MAPIGERIKAVRRRVGAAAERAGRDPAEVRLVGVVKGMPTTAVATALAGGLSDIAENYVQEAEGHQRELGEAAKAGRWHLVGHLQRNKVAAALRLFATIETIDSLRLAEQLSDRCADRLPVMIEVNVAAEPTKSGVEPAAVAALVAAVGRLDHLDLTGLMTVAPAFADAEQARPVFRELRRLAQANGLVELSMGMSDDFEIAVEEGATQVRIGRAIFGERPR